MEQSFIYGGQVHRILDMDAERGAHTHRTPHLRPFLERAEEVIAELSAEEKQQKFLIVYSRSGELYATGTPEVISRLTTIGQGSLYHQMKKKMMHCCVIGIFCKDGDSYKPLFDIRRFERDATPIFLCKKQLHKVLLQFFNQVTLSIEIISEECVQSIAWKIVTEEGTFHLLWHNGCIIKDIGTCTTTEKNFDEVRKSNVYNTLRFGFALTGESNCYRIVCS